ncbi:MAG: hypothetical protein GSR79_00405 [Desulfurococcales archaeon]|nr:hypothetical protein [Desulfurococcales archaeon]
MSNTSQRLSKSCVEKVRDFDGNIIAIKFNFACINDEGTWILTPSSWGLQVGIFKHNKGYVVEAHTHPRERCGRYNGNEMLYVITGRLKINLFNEKGKLLKDITLNKGDCLIINSGHSVEVLEEASVLEVKEGPYPGPVHDKNWLKIS